MMTLNRQSGVTLTELLITLSVIAILLTLSAPSFSEFINKRQITGATNLVASYFDNVKMEAARRNSFITVTYQQNSRGTQWCFGAKAGRHNKCDCLAQGDEMDCKLTVGDDDQPMVLTNVPDQGQGFIYDPAFGNVRITDNLDDNKDFSFNPVHGTVSHMGTYNPGVVDVRIDVMDQSQTHKVVIRLTPTGRVSKCTDPNYPLVGFPECS
jgi:prepilin-type N-terminal cleavage/methylation domain-containing protein